MKVIQGLLAVVAPLFFATAQAATSVGVVEVSPLYLAVIFGVLATLAMVISNILYTVDVDRTAIALAIAAAAFAFTASEAVVATPIVSAILVVAAIVAVVVAFLIIFGCKKESAAASMVFCLAMGLAAIVIW